MGLFDIFKKKKAATPDYTNLTPMDMDVGYIFDYDLSTWTVDEVFVYDWGNDFFSKEFQVNNSKYTAYLSVEQDDELEMAMTRKIKIRSIDENLPEYITSHKSPPPKITYQGIDLLLDKEAPGYCGKMDMPDEDWEEFISWDYYDKNEDFVLTIEQWDENTFEASFGKVVKYFQISNIFPNPELNTDI